MGKSKEDLALEDREIYPEMLPPADFLGADLWIRARNFLGALRRVYPSVIFSVRVSFQVEGPTYRPSTMTSPIPGLDFGSSAPSTTTTEKQE
jgi:hypothetical protein